MKLRVPQPRQPFIALALAAVAGIGAAEFGSVPPLLALALPVLGAVAVLLRPKTPACLFLCTLVFFELHTLRHHGSEARELAGLFASGPRVVHATGIVWNEPAKPATPSRTTTARFRLRVESLEIDGHRLSPRIMVNVSWAGSMPVYGDRVSLRGSAAGLAEKRNPGQFDFARHLQRQGIYTEIHTRFANDCVIEGHGHGNPLQAFAYRTSRWIQRQLRLDLEGSPEISDLIASMVLGLRGETPEDMKELFQRTGTMHLFAVSGLNVAMLAAIVLALLRAVGLRRGAAICITIPVLFGYALVTGLTPSCVRATIMMTLVLLGFLTDRHPLTLNSLGAAAFLILAWDTTELFSPGFQFSFVLVITIVWLAGKIQRRLEHLGHPDDFLPRDLWNTAQRGRVWIARRVAMAFGVTIAAWLGSLLFTAGYFHLFSPSAIFANLFAVPLAFGVLVLGLATILAAPWWKTGAILCNNANWFCAKALLWVLEVFALIPGGYVYIEAPKLARPPDCEFTVFDLGDGGAMHLRTGRHDWLFDCGGGGDYERIVLPYLRSRGVNRLEGLLVTHGDTRHLGGALAAIHDFAPRTIVDSTLRDRSSTRRSLHAQLAAREMGKALYERGDWLHFDDHFALRILHPPSGLRRSTADDMALVVQLHAGGVRALFMSDSGLITEEWLLENEPDLRSDLLIKGQHLKDFSGTANFLARVQPQAIICSGPGYGEPTAKLDAWENATAVSGTTIFRQDRTGAVSVEIRDGAFALRGFVNGQTFHSRAE